MLYLNSTKKLSADPKQLTDDKFEFYNLLPVLSPSMNIMFSFQWVQDVQFFMCNFKVLRGNKQKERLNFQDKKMYNFVFDGLVSFTFYINVGTFSYKEKHIIQINANSTA